jgi:hypothetical protein
MAANENQLDLIGRNIDRVITVEARISGTSRNVIAHLYEAARPRQGAGPLSMLAACRILIHGGRWHADGRSGCDRHVVELHRAKRPGRAVQARLLSRIVHAH